jgi:hypothetical protein
MRWGLTALMLVLAACSPAPAPIAPESPGANSAGSNGEAEAPDPERDAMLAALIPAVSAEIGAEVTFTVETKRTQGDWGWIVARPWTPDGAQIDWSSTALAERAREGALDGGGATYALLRRQSGQWRVVAFAVGPTDVAYADWPQRYGAPAPLMDLPRN